MSLFDPNLLSEYSRLTYIIRRFSDKNRKRYIYIYKNYHKTKEYNIHPLIITTDSIVIFFILLLNRKGYSTDISGQVENLEISETSETSEFCFRLFLFRIFDFDLIPKIENSEKKSWDSELSEVSEFSICHFLEFLIKCPRFNRFKFQFNEIECVSCALLFSFLTLFGFDIVGY